MIFFSQRKIIFLLFFIIFLGLFLRCYLILTKNIFIDEVFYWEVARMNSIFSILKIEHWIKDHGILYYVFLKRFLFFTTDIILLRFTNIIFYLISSLLIFIYFYKLGFGYLSLLPVFLYSVSRYFIYLNSHVSPYNLVFFFALGSILSLIGFIFKNDDKQFKIISYLYFVLFTILGFYSDYSFFYMFFFYLIVFLYVLLYKRELLKSIIFAYLIIFLAVLPGTIQFFNNFNAIKSLFFASDYKNKNLISFFSDLSQVLVFRQNNLISSFYLILLFIIPFLIRIKNNFLIRIHSLLVLSFLLNILLQFVVINYFLPIFIERSFWYFYLSLIILVSINFFVLFYLKKKLLSWFLIVVFIVFMIFNHFNFQIFSILGENSEDIQYNKLIQYLIVDKKNKIEKIFLVDKIGFFSPLTNYFFSDSYPPTAKFYKEINDFKQGVEFYRVRFIEEIDNNHLNNKQKIILIIFFPSQSEIEYLINLKNRNNNLSIYYFSVSNKKNKVDVFRL